MTRKVKIYLAGPFFTKEQQQVATQLESLLKDATDNYEVKFFSPRQGEASQEMKMYQVKGEQPPQDLRERVFRDNVENIDDADLLLAYIDNFDPGTIYEVGYAYASSVPVLSFSAKGYGMNLMLAQSVIGHTRGLDELEEALDLILSILSIEDTMKRVQELTKFTVEYTSSAQLSEKFE